MSVVTECTVDPVDGVFTHHDFSQPPHNTPNNPRDVEDPCQPWPWRYGRHCQDP